MRLPRRKESESLRTVVAEQQSVRASAITPREAAATQMAKYNAIAKASGSFAQVFEGLGEIQADEEYVNARSSYTSAIQALHNDLENIQIEEDKTGNLVYEPDKILQMEAEARKSLYGAIRGNIRSGRAKRAFDKWSASSGVTMGKDGVMTTGGGSEQAKFAKKVAEIHGKVIKANVVTQIESLLDADKFEEANTRNREAIETGAFGVTEYNEWKTEIRKRGVRNGVWDVLNTPAALQNKVDINEQLEILEDPEMTDLSDEEISVLRGKLYSALDNQEKVVAEENEDQYRKTYNEMLPRAVEGSLGLTELINSGIPPDDSLFQDLLGRIDGTDGEPESTPGALQDYRNRIRALSSRAGVLDEQDWGESVENLIDEMQAIDSGLNYTDAQALADELTGDLKAIYNTETYKVNNRMAYQQIAGYEPGMYDNMEAMYSSQFKESNLIALEFQEALAAEAKVLGPGRQDQLSAWRKEQAPVFKAKLNDKLFRSVGVNIDWDNMEGGFTAEVKLDIQRQMYEHLDKYTGDLSKAEEVIAEMERLNGITLLGVRQ